MKQQFNYVSTLATQQGDDATKHLNKLTEEVGELAQGINKIFGLKAKKKNETQAKIVSNIKEEIADSIQCLFAIASTFEISYKDLKAELDKKNISYANYLTLRN